MPPPNLPLRDRALEVLRAEPWLSSQEVANRVGSVYGSVSSLLLRLVREGVLIRADNCGPRKGWGYAEPGTPLPQGNIVWKKVPRPVQDQVLDALKENPWFTVTEVATAMGRNQGSVYSALQRLIKDGRVKTMGDCGSRGGKGYATSNEKTLRVRGQYITRPTLWDHLEC